MGRIHWVVSDAAAQWIREVSEASGIPYQRLGEKLIRYHAEQLPEDEHASFEAVIETLGPRVSARIDWES